MKLLRISSISINPEETIIVNYDDMHIKPVQLKQFYDGIKSILPNNDVIILPSEITLHTMLASQLYGYIQKLQTIYEHKCLEQNKS